MKYHILIYIYRYTIIYIYIDNLYISSGDESTINPSYFGVHQGAPKVFIHSQVVKASSVDNTEAWPDVVVERPASRKNCPGDLVHLHPQTG